ncbi:MAG: F0F1 ATP synthase subunit B [Alphaproteobacteria bacterium]|nr:F0F1 ATP synthase subunit B [Alphaproteobacteria bacterium]
MEILQDTNTWVIVSFVLFFLLVAWKGRSAIANAIDGRIERIRSEIAQAEQLKEEATSKLAELKRAQRDATDQAAAIVENAKNETKTMKKEQDARFKEAMERREKQAMDKIAQAEANAIAEVRSLAVDMAIAATTQVLKDRMGGKEGDKAIDDAIATLPTKFH